MNFKTCYPGWGQGQTTHIHFTVSNNNNDQVVLKLCFADGVTPTICTTPPPEYTARGIQDTTLAGDSDPVFANDHEPYLPNVAKR